MTDLLSPQAFLAMTGIDGWRVIDGHAVATYPTIDFAEGAAFVAEIAILADAANHHPDVTLRYGSVTIELVTHDAGGLTRRDVDLARQLSIAARARGLAPRDH